MSNQTGRKICFARKAHPIGGRRRRIWRVADDARVVATTRDSDDDSDEEEEEEEELAKIETLAQFFYQCASVDLTFSRGTHTRDWMSSVEETTKT